MKNSFLSIAIILLLASCQYTATENDTTDSTGTTAGFHFLDEVPSARDTSIDSSVAYNNLFIDTASVERYISLNKVNEAEAQAIKKFYNLRNYQYAWFAQDGLTEQGRAFWNLYNYTNKSSNGQKKQPNDKQLVARMDILVELDTLMVAANDTSFNATEVAVTHRFIKYYSDHNNASVLHQLPFSFLLPTRKMDPLTMADSVLNYNSSATTSDSTGEQFAALKMQLASYDSIAKNGGWQPVPARIGILRKGSTSPAITAIKKRLHASGDYMGTDTLGKFTDSFDIAIRSYQERNGFKVNGLITDSLVTVMNVPVQQRIQQTLLNINRMAWMPPQLKDNYVAVNIPSYMLEVYEGDSIPVKMEVVVGKEGSNTMMFTGDMNQVVFNPTWRLPESIVKSEILPAMKNDPNYLKKQRMEIVGTNESIPQIKQLPGAGNSLGRAKFLFPNSYDIYLHDTEAKALFAQQKRTFSHGCIRVADAEALSKYVLRNDNNWTADKIKAAMTGEKEQTVAVKNPLPVMITYYTLWVDKNGQVQFREDIYQHDKRTGAMMFKAAPATV